MKMKRRVIALSITMALSANGIAARDTQRRDAPLLPATTLTEDVDLLRRAVFDAHPAPDRYLTAADLESAFARARVAASRPLRVTEFYRVLLGPAERIRLDVGGHEGRAARRAFARPPARGA
jgi:hypothetical protein